MFVRQSAPKLVGTFHHQLSWYFATSLDTSNGFQGRLSCLKDTGHKPLWKGSNLGFRTFYGNTWEGLPEIWYTMSWPLSKQIRLLQRSLDFPYFGGILTWWIRSTLGFLGGYLNVNNNIDNDKTVQTRYGIRKRITMKLCFIWVLFLSMKFLNNEISQLQCCMCIITKRDNMHGHKTLQLYILITHLWTKMQIRKSRRSSWISIIMFNSI